MVPVVVVVIHEVPGDENLADLHVVPLFVGVLAVITDACPVFFVLIDRGEYHFLCVCV